MPHYSHEGLFLVVKAFNMALIVSGKGNKRRVNFKRSAVIMVGVYSMGFSINTYYMPCSSMTSAGSNLISKIMGYDLQSPTYSESWKLIIQGISD